jgi:nitric oxide reductase NorD protein
VPEAEDVIVDAARHATSYAMDLWRRNRARSPEPPGVALADVRERLELWIEGSLGTPIPIRTAAVPPPRTLLSRFFDRGKRQRRTDVALPGTDGVAVYLPRSIDGDVAAALSLYRVASLLQALRMQRGTVSAFPHGDPPLVQDLFLIAETAAAEATLVSMLPGFARAMTHARRAALAARSPIEGLEEPLRSVELLYRAYLETGRATCAGDVHVLLGWARAKALQLSSEARAYRSVSPDMLLGVVLQPDASTVLHATCEQPPSFQQVQHARLTRRPRARRAPDDEDDEKPGLWMIQTSQPSEHAEDAMGLQRPVDRQPDEDLQGAAESVSDLEELRLVSTPGSPREIFAGDEPVFVRATATLPETDLAPGALAYPEWDYTRAMYLEHAAIVRTVEAAEGSSSWVDSVITKHHATLVRVRRQFEALRSRRVVQHAQQDGDDIDLQAFVAAYGDRRARRPREDRWYVKHRPARPDFALLLLIDVSASTEAWCGGAYRIIDLEKEALVVVSAALDAMRVPFAIQAFSGYGPGEVRMRDVKRFSEAFGHALARRVAGLEPDEYTRAGAALRHATATLMRQPGERRILLLLSDGKPNDCDRYEGRYGAEDTRQALAEARLHGIVPFCLTVDRSASRYLPAIFDAGHYSVVTHPEHMTRALLEWLRSVTAAMA